MSQVKAEARPRFLLPEDYIAVDCISGGRLCSFIKRCPMHEDQYYRPLMNRFYPNASPGGRAHA